MGRWFNHSLAVKFRVRFRVGFASSARFGYEVTELPTELVKAGLGVRVRSGHWCL